MKRSKSWFSYIDEKGYAQEVSAYNLNKKTEDYCEFEIVIKGKSIKMIYLKGKFYELNKHFNRDNPKSKQIVPFRYEGVCLVTQEYFLGE